MERASRPNTRPSNPGKAVKLVEYKPEIDYKEAKKLTKENQAILLRTDTNRTEENHEELEFVEFNGKAPTLRKLTHEERELEYELLIKQQEEDIVFMDYHDIADADLAAVHGIDIDDNSDYSDDYLSIEVDPNNFYSNALIFEPANNGLEGVGSPQNDISIASFSDIPIEQLLATKHAAHKASGNPFMKTFDKTVMGAIQANYSAVWFQDMNDDGSIKMAPTQLLQNRETFSWIKKNFRYKESVPLSDREKGRILQPPKPKKPVILDPKISDILERMNIYLAKLQDKRISKDRYLKILARLHNVFVSSFNKISNFCGELKFVNRLLVVRNKNLLVSLKTVNSEVRQIEQSNQAVFKDKVGAADPQETLEALRQRNLEQMSHYLGLQDILKMRDGADDLQREDKRLRRELEGKQKLNAELHDLLLKLQKIEDFSSQKYRRAVLARENGKSLQPIFEEPRPKNRSLNARKFRTIIANNPLEDDLHKIELENVIELTKAFKANTNAKKEELEVEGILVKSRSKPSMTGQSIPPVSQDKSVSYIKSVLHNFLENDELDTANQVYITGRNPPPLLKSQIVNNSNPATFQEGTIRNLALQEDDPRATRRTIREATSASSKSHPYSFQVV